MAAASADAAAIFFESSPDYSVAKRRKSPFTLTLPTFDRASRFAAFRSTPATPKCGRSSAQVLWQTFRARRTYHIVDPREIAVKHTYVEK